MLGELLGALATALCLYAAYNLLLHPLSSLPGPLLVRAGLWSFKTTRAIRRDAAWKFKELHDAYGTVVRIARDEASICDPEAISQIYRFKEPLHKPLFYSFFRAPEADGLFSLCANEPHAALRRAQLPAFTMSTLLGLEKYIDACGVDLFKHLDEACGGAEKGKATVEMASLLQYLAMDVVGELAFGTSFGLARSGKDKTGFVPIVTSFNFSSCLAGTQPFMGSLLLSLASKLQGGVEGAQELSRMAWQCVLGRIKEARTADGKPTGNDGRQDILSKLILAKHVDGRPLSDTDVYIASFAVLAAGSDTTAITMRALIRNVVGNPRVYAKVLEEIDEAVESGEITFPISYEQGQKLVYIQACLRETLRLTPAVTWSFPRIVSDGGETIAGRHFAGGTVVSMSPFVVHRRKEAYGDDAETFRPERWLETTEDEKRSMDHNLLTFGHGPRICIGRNVSIAEITKILPALFYRYHLSFTPRSPTSPHKSEKGRAFTGELSVDEPWDLTSQWFALASDFWCDIKPRKTFSLDNDAAIE